MNGRMIDPKDVPEMFRNGTLWHGIELEFCQNFNAEGRVVVRGFLVGFDDKKQRKFICENQSVFGHFAEARFPLPDLRDGDPIIEIDGGVHRRVHFSNQCGDESGIWVYRGGKSQWSSRACTEYIEGWRIPTPDELEAAGLDRNWFAGRRGIPQLTERTDG